MKRAVRVTGDFVDEVIPNFTDRLPSIGSYLQGIAECSPQRSVLRTSPQRSGVIFYPPGRPCGQRYCCAARWRALAVLSIEHKRQPESGQDGSKKVEMKPVLGGGLGEDAHSSSLPRTRGGERRSRRRKRMHQRMTPPKQHTVARLVLSVLMIGLAGWSFLADPGLRATLVSLAALTSLILAGVMIADMRARRR